MAARFCPGGYQDILQSMMRKMLQIRFLKKDEVSLGQRYIKELWSANHFLARDRALFEWQYQSPVEDDSQLGFIIAEDAEEHIGCIGRMPVRCHVHGQPVTGAAIALFVTNPAHRHSAAGLELLKKAYEGLDIVITQGINSHVAKLYRMLGQHVVPAMPRYVCRGHMDSLYAMWKAGNPTETFPEERYNLVPPVHQPEPVKNWYEEPLIGNNLEEWDLCWKRQFAPACQGSIKDARALRWRYLEHPTFHYEAFLVKNAQKDIGGLAVLRRIHLPGNVQALRIMDFLCKDEAAGQALASGIVDRVTANTAFIEFVCLGHSWHSLHRHLGLSTVGNDLFSVCFNPPDFTRCAIMASFASRMPGLSSKDLVISPETYITIADGDQDRPN